MNKFVLLSDRRSGTTLLTDTLAKHPNISCVKRAFGQEKKVRNPTPNHHSGAFYLFRTATLNKRLRFLIGRKALLEQFLNEEIFSAKSDADIAGFRLIYAQTKRYPELIDLITSNNISVIHLVRENILKTYISTITAPLHKMHHPRSGDKLKTVTIRLDPEETLRQLERRSKTIENMRKTFSHGKYLEVRYESFVANRETESKRLLSFLGNNDSDMQESDLMKINPDSVKDIIENYSEIEEALGNTRFKHFLV